MDYRHYHALTGKERTLGFMQAHEFAKRFWHGPRFRREGVCPCGKHQGLTLLNNGEVHEFAGVRAEGLCPVSFWLAKFQIILIEKNGKEAIAWSGEHPLTEFLRRFSLESIEPKEERRGLQA